MIVFDTSVLVLAFDDTAGAPKDPATGLVLEKCKERITHLIDALSSSKERILIPTPVIAEYLVRGGEDKDKRAAELINSRVFTIAPFDIKAAIECALLESGRTPKRDDDVATKAQVKYDRQIVAIAKAHGARVIYTGDERLAKCANSNGISTVMTWEMPLPPVEAQSSLDLDFTPTTSSPKRGSW